LNCQFCGKEHAQNIQDIPICNECLSEIFKQLMNEQEQNKHSHFSSIDPSEGTARFS